MVKLRRDSRYVWNRSSSTQFGHRISIIKFLFHFISLLTCLFCLLYQTWQLLSLYFSGKTIAESRVERLANSRLPAITVCLPTFMDMEKFAKLYLKTSANSNDGKLYEDHQVNKKFVMDNGWNQEAQDSQKALFEKFLWESYVLSNISLFDTFHLYSADMELEYKVYFGKTKYNKAFNVSDMMIELPLPRQDVSLVPYIDPRVCVTVFSDFDDNFKDKALVPIEIDLRFLHNISSFPFTRYYEGDFYVSLHSPNVLPDYKRENVFQKLTMGMVNFVTYSEVQTKLLPQPYDTNCRNYDHITRGDCVHHCFIDKLDTIFDLDCVWTWNNNKLIRKGAPGDLLSKPFCDHQRETRIWDIAKEQFHVERQCDNECPRNCLESHYQYEIQTRRGDAFREDFNCFTINLDHNRFPDQVIEHKPIMDWITLVSNWGGLLGMWMGLSVLYMCNKFINKMFDRYSLSETKMSLPLSLPFFAMKSKNKRSVTPSFNLPFFISKIF